MKTLKLLLGFALLFSTFTLYAQQGGYALQFDGSDDHVDCGNSSSFYMNGGSAITIEAWINTKNINQDWQAIAGKQIPYNGVYSIIIESNSKKVALYLNLGGTWLSRVNSNTVLEQDKWYHVAATYNGSSAKMYINGKLDNSAACTGTITDNLSVSFYIGKNNSVCFNGKLDEIRVWNIARTEAEIKANMYKEIGIHTNLKAYYKMSDGTGTSLTDNSGNGNTGTLTSGPVWKASGCFAGSGQAFEFDGTAGTSGEYVKITNGSALIANQNNMTIEFWIYPTKTGPWSYWETDYEGIFNFGTVNDFYFVRWDNFLQVRYNSTTAGQNELNGCPVEINKWQHFALVYNGSSLKLYKNGVLAQENNSLNPGTPYPYTNKDLTIGKSFYSSYHWPFKGQIDDFRIWTVARTVSEICDNMFKTLNGNETGLTAYFRFDQTDGITTVYDMSANGNNGTLVNTESTDWVSSTAFNTWLGGESNAWATAGNWSNGTPTSAQSAGIYNWSSALPNVTTYLPLLPATISVNNFLVPSGVSASGNVNLTATGSVFLGSNLTLSSAALNTAGNLKIESGKTLTIPTSGQLTVSSYLTNSAGNSGLVIESGGSLIHNSNSVAATVKREITGSSALTQKKYHFVSIPTQYASPTSNLFLGSYLYKLDPTQLYTTNHYGSWVALGTSTTTELQTNQGYMIYYPDASKTYTFEGNLNNGTYNYSLTGHTGSGVYTFNLVPNPYPSAVVWNTGGTGWSESAGVGGTCYVWNATSGNYTSVASAADAYIPAGQALMVLVTNEASPTLSVNNNARTHSTQAFYKAVTEVENQLVIKANANNYADETAITFGEEFTEGFDLQTDGMKLFGLEDAPQLYTLSGNEKFSINHLPMFEGQKIVPMNFETQFSGDITMDFSGMESFDPSLNIYLQDLLTNQTINLRNQQVYTFLHNPVNAANRFQLVFGGTIGIGETASQPGILWIAGNTLFINTPKLACQAGLLEVFDASGQVLLTREIVLSELSTIALKQQGLVVVRLTTGGDVMTVKGVLLAY